MKLLIIDTTAGVATVIYSESDEIKTYYTMDGMKSTSKNLLVLIEKCLKDNSIELSNVDYVGGVTGPGSFTGIRIGLSFINGCSIVATAPLIALSSFEKMIDSNDEKLYLIDALHDSFYSCRAKGLCTSYTHGISEKEELILDPIEKVYFEDKEENIDRYAKNLVAAMKFHISRNDTVKSLFAVYIRKSQAERERDAKS